MLSKTKSRESLNSAERFEKVNKREAIECLIKIKWHIDAGKWGTPYTDENHQTLYKHKLKQLEALDWAIELIKQQEEKV